MWREDGRCSRTSFNLCEQEHCRDCTLDPGTCSSPQFSICAVLVGFQPYKSILWSCFAHSYKPYLFSWCCGVRVCWGRSLQSVTSCGLLSDWSSVGEIPLAVPTASCSHTCCWLFWCSSHVCASCFETLWWERAFLNLAPMDRGCECFTSSEWCKGSRVWMQQSWCGVCMQREFFTTNRGAFCERHSLLTSLIHNRAHCRDSFFLASFPFS